MNTEDPRLLEKRADIVRSRLLRTLDALDTRRHQVTEIGTRAKKLGGEVALGALAVVCLGAGALLFVKARARHSTVGRLLRQARGFRVPPRRSFWVTLAQRATTAFVTMMVTEVGRRVAKNALDGRFPDGRLLVGGFLDKRHKALSAKGATK